MPYIADREYDKLVVDHEFWKSEAESAHNREVKLVIEIRNGQAKINRLMDQLERCEMLKEAKK